MAVREEYRGRNLDGGNPLHEISGRTPLHWAVYKGHLEVVSRLLARGAQIDAVTKFRSTLLHLAASGGHPEVVSLLLARGAKTGAVNRSGQTPLHLAASEGHLEVVNLLLAGGAQTGAVTKDGKTALDLARKEAVRSVLLSHIETLKRGGSRTMTRCQEGARQATVGVASPTPAVTSSSSSTVSDDYLPIAIEITIIHDKHSLHP